MNVAAELFCTASLPDALPIFTPSTNTVPDACEYDSVTGPTRSVTAAGAYVTAAPYGPGAPATTSGTTAANTRAAASHTVTLNVAVELLWNASVAVTVTVVVPS